MKCKIFSGFTGVGKTTKLIKESFKNNTYIVCGDPRYVFNFAESLGYKIPFPLSYREFLENKYQGKNINGFLIDNIDVLFRLLKFHDIDGFSLSSNDFEFIDLNKNPNPEKYKDRSEARALEVLNDPVKISFLFHKLDILQSEKKYLLNQVATLQNEINENWSKFLKKEGIK